MTIARGLLGNACAFPAEERTLPSLQKQDVAASFGEWKDCIFELRSRRRLSLRTVAV
jgi:hypothetical protein